MLERTIECDERGFATRFEKIADQLFAGFFIGLTQCHKLAQQLSGTTAIDGRSQMQLLAQVNQRLFRLGDGVHLRRDCDHEGLNSQHAFAGPPAIDGGLAGSGPGSDTFDGELRKTTFTQDLVRRFQDR